MVGCIGCARTTVTTRRPFSESGTAELRRKRRPRNMIKSRCPRAPQNQSSLLVVFPKHYEAARKVK
ncbi:hypothetical protein GQ600_13180 [Phytophthora cactorum]|nr:hypothetical protein GQ600_13180 [Phytophthora cactorum]